MFRSAWVKKELIKPNINADIKKTGGYDALKEWKREYSTSELIEPLLYLLEGTNRLEDAEDFPEYKINKVPVEQKLLKQSRKERLADKEHYVSPESFTRWPAHISFAGASQGTRPGQDWPHLPGR